MEIFLILFLIILIIGFPIYIYVSVKSYFEERTREKNNEERNRAYALNPILKYLAMVRALSDRKRDDLILLGTLRRGGINTMAGYNTPFTLEVNKITGLALKDVALTTQDRDKLNEYIEFKIGQKLKDESQKKADYEREQLIKKIAEAQKIEKYNAKIVRRKLMIDRLSGSRSYVQIDKDSPLLSNINKPFRDSDAYFIFKSNIWEYLNGGYILFEGATYNEGVVNLFDNLIKLKREKKIRRINNINDPRTV
jgi:hypothetical protein